MDTHPSGLHVLKYAIISKIFYPEPKEVNILVNFFWTRAMQDTGWLK
jgi:hypothetical protein